MPNFTVAGAPSQDLALTNCIFLSPSDHALLTEDADLYVEIGGIVFTCRANEKMAQGLLGFNSVQRRLLTVSNGDSVLLERFTGSEADAAGLASAVITVDHVVKGKARGNDQIEAAELSQAVQARFATQFLTVGQQLVVEWQGNNLLLTVQEVEAVAVSASGTGGAVGRGMLASQTQLGFVKAAGATIVISGAAENAAAKTNIFKSDFSFEKMGIGGLDIEFSDIFRRAFASRIFPVSVLRKLGINHVKGMLLYGPPGTGKTLIARQIGKMLNGREPKVVHGPEVLSKYVGQSEENVRALFAEAEAEYQARGDDSELHIIIFDEIDSVCKARGSSRDGTGVHDTVVNQLLSKIDGVHSLNNILVIGMTNRRDMIDEALLRPGRLEVQVEISLPDEAGRHQILTIHTAAMRVAKYLSDDVQLESLASATKNFSGAEIEGLVKSAASFAFARQVQVDNLKHTNVDALQVTKADFDHALSEVRPAFGVSTDDLSACMRGGLIAYGGALPQLQETAARLISQLRSSERTSLVSVLFEGVSGCGKTALAAALALESGFPFVRLVSPQSLLGMNESSKAQLITKIFDDAHRSPLSVVLLDELERILEYVRIGPRFSNVVLQTLLTCIKKVPQKNKVVILATTSSADVLESLELVDAFNVKLSVPALQPPQALCVLRELGVSNAHEVEPILASVTGGLPVKKLLLVVEMAMEEGSAVGGKVRLDPSRFALTLQDSGLLA